MNQTTTIDSGYNYNFVTSNVYTVNDVTIEFIKTHEDAKLPQKAHQEDTGIDIYAVEDTTIPARGSAVVPVGLKLAHITPGYWFQIDGRSGLNFKHGVVPQAGIVDQGYRGDLGIKLYNLTDKPLTLRKGDGAAQLIVYPVYNTTTRFVSEAAASERGENGFGSTGGA